jgi:hypothetical protein
MTILKHNFMPYVGALFVPLVIAGLVPRFLRNVDIRGLQCSDPDGDTDTYTQQAVTVKPSGLTYGTIIGPPEIVSELESLVPTVGFCYPAYRGGAYCENSDYGVFWNETTTVTSAQELYASVTPGSEAYSYSGGFFIPDDGPPVLAYTVGYSFSTAVSTLAALDMALSDTSLAVSYVSFGGRYTPKDFYQSLVAVFTTIGFCLFPGLFALYPTRERLQKVRAMQYSNGITSGPLWTGYALFDFCFLLVISALVTVIWLTNGYAYFGLGYMFL